MYNASGLFYKSTYSDRFVNKLTISDHQDQLLLSSRKKIRLAIRTAFSNVRQYLAETASETDIQKIALIQPKFMTQGSYAYRTLNLPCHRCQEIDLDDGVYLPMTFFKNKPETNKDMFFAIVDGAMKDLALHEGWRFEKKETCARLVLPHQMHIDVPLYAVPNERHVEMAEAKVRLKQENLAFSDIFYRGDLAAASAYLLSEDEIYLATRTGSWKASDPLAIALWFKREINIRGQGSGRRLRRICRYLKSWRDYVWENGGPSSLTLMVCAVNGYPTNDQGRDDYALLQVAKSLPQQLSSTIINPAAPNEDPLYPRGKVDTEEVSSQAELLVNALGSGLSGAIDKNGLLSCLESQFGSRIPQNTEWIEEVSSAAAIVRSTQSVPVKPEIIPNARSA